MAESYLTLTNKVLARLNEVQLTSGNFSSARGIQVQVQNAVNEAIRYINQKEFGYPFNHATNTQVLVPGTVKYTLPSSTKHVDYNTARIVKNSTLGTSGANLSTLAYNEYIANNVEQEDDIVTTTTSTTHTDSVTTITVSSTSGFDSSAASIASGVQVAQFTGGGVPSHIVRTLDNNFILYPFPNRGYTLKFDYFTFPSDLSAHDDTTTIPDRFAPVIVDGATAYSYQYRGEIEQYQLNFARFEQGIKNIQTLLVNKYDYVRSTVILRPTSMAGYFSTETTT